MRKVVTLISLALLAGTAGCTTEKTAPPPLTGPSEYALRFVLQSIPDSILQDGASQSSIQIEAIGGDGRPARALPLRLEMSVLTAGGGETFADFGTLSAKSVITGEDGRARVVYTAPPRPVESVDQFTTVRVYVTPIGSDYQGEQPRFVALRLVPPGVILPPNTAPVPEFTSSGSLVPFSDIVFDASPTTDEGVSCGAACTYTWDFGDGSTGSGIFVRHQYRESKTFQLKLSATDARGASGTVARPIQIGAATPPTAAFTFSPQGAIGTNQTIFFNAEGSRAATGRRLTRYDWNFGNGRTDSGVTTSYAYPTAGTYLVTLIVTDDIGEKSTPVSQSLTVGGGSTALTASLVTLPNTSPTNAASLVTTIIFDASASSGPARIVEYRFNMGDGTPDVVQTALPTWSYRYTAGGIYTARVTVRDSEGRTATATRVVYVQ